MTKNDTPSNMPGMEGSWEQIKRICDGVLSFALTQKPPQILDVGKNMGHIRNLKK